MTATEKFYEFNYNDYHRKIPLNDTVWDIQICPKHEIVINEKGEGSLKTVHTLYVQFSRVNNININFSSRTEAMERANEIAKIFNIPDWKVKEEDEDED